MAYLDDIYAVLQVAPTGVPTYVRLSQNENGRRMYFSVVGGEIPTGSTATISGTKPDGVVYSASCSINGSTVTVNETIQLTAAAGEWDAKLKIMNGGQTIATGRIRFVIDADTVAPGSVPSDSELEGLVAEAAGYAEAAKDAAYYGSPLMASTVAEMTDHNRVYVYTGSESGYTSGNWYFWDGSAWTSGGVYNATAVQTDKTLKVADMAADAKAVGDELTSLKADLANIRPGLSDNAKIALLDCFAHVAWIGDDGQDYYDALHDALYEDTVYITASFTQGDNYYFTDDALDDLKENLVVTYHGESDRILSPSEYVLSSGNLIQGNNIITVTYQNYVATFVVALLVNRVTTLDNILHPTAAASGTYTISDGKLNVKTASQSAVDNWWCWIADTRSNYWADVLGKTLKFRIKVKKLGTTDEDGSITLAGDIFRQSEITGLNDNTRRQKILITNAIPSTEQYVKYQASMLADINEFTVGTFTPDENTTVGQAIFVRSLDVISFAEIKMGVE